MSRMSGDGSDNDAAQAVIGCDDAEVDFIENGTAEDVAAWKVNWYSDSKKRCNESICHAISVISLRILHYISSYSIH